MFFGEEDKQSEYPGDQNIEQMLEELVLGEESHHNETIKRDSTIFAIDCCKQMLNTLEGQKDSEMDKILESYSNFMMSKIIANATDQVGLILYNINAKSNTLNFDDIYVVQNLESPSAEAIKKGGNVLKDYIQKYGITDRTVPLHHLLWLYGHCIKDLQPSKFHLRLFIFTCDDCPHPEGDERRDLAINHARQLTSKNVQIQLFPIRYQKKSVFDIRKFYQQILTLDTQQINDTVIDSSSKILDLQSRLRQKQFKKRTLNRLLLKIGNETTVGAKIFSLFNKAKKPLGKKVEATTNKPLQRVVKKLNNKGELLFDEQIGTFYPLGGEKIRINKQDMSKIKSIEPPGLTLVGFKPKHLIKPYHNLRTSYFVYPDEQHVSGSMQFFDALIDELTDTGMVGIAKICARGGQELRFAALIPQKEKYDDEDHYQTPPGFNLISLPYANDIANHMGNKTIVEPQKNISSETIQITKLLINSMTVPDFDFRDFQNPSLQKFYTHLQAHALNEENVQQRPDLLMPDYEGLDKVKDIAKMLKEVIAEQPISEDIPCQKVKREVKRQKQTMKEVKKEEPEKKSKVKKKNQVKKQIKIEEDEDDGELREVQQLIFEGEGNSLKVTSLRKYLKAKGLEDKGKKEELIDRIMVFIHHRNAI